MARPPWRVKFLPMRRNGRPNNMLKHAPRRRGIRRSIHSKQFSSSDRNFLERLKRRVPFRPDRSRRCRAARSSKCHCCSSSRSSSGYRAQASRHSTAIPPTQIHGGRTGGSLIAMAGSERPTEDTQLRQECEHCRHHQPAAKPYKENSLAKKVEAPELAASKQNRSARREEHIESCSALMRLSPPKSS
jgi:hypothetical protein